MERLLNLIFYTVPASQQVEVLEESIQAVSIGVSPEVLMEYFLAKLNEAALELAS
ncbi:MAG: hypothetical protein HYU64_05545 [Armatimonadetes bacterium]|nr:hypothetical protein [Armatimonadota bacterium]